MGGLQWQGQWDPFREIRQEVGRLLGNIETMSLRVPRPFPAINLYDEGDRYYLTAELPGISASEIDLGIAGQTVTIRGERRRPEGVPEETYRRQERQFGRWARSVTFPDRIDSAGVSASFARGILTVVVPKNADARPRQIAVSSAE
ncbi:Hsp20/alpha crystallin family protein [Tautonia sociabilis]|uniref:Hsp20/alpha crystallin family protein n=1 Tax=Tautonia sociabilis TaxID=2080755 RepID=A0A432MKV4_9BACT|nr:Hsp20/alpha crystallin family protein [Tautonia sociabilis]RUL88053.1 Hsp20/alpha crystallin family protein [Tautonia sociabilis]